MSDTDSDFEDLLDDEEAKSIQLKKRTANIIQNRIESQKPKYKSDIDLFISGPNRLVTMKKDSQTVRLFGEWHGFDRNCSDQVKLRSERIMTITKYLQTMLEKGDVDLYLEAPLLHLQKQEDIDLFNEQKKIHEQYNKELPFLLLTRDSLKWCLNPKYRNNTDLCPFKMSRVHSTDIRPFTEYTKMSNKLRFEMSDDSWDELKKQHAKLIDTLKTIKNCNDYVDFILKMIYQYKNPILKELQRSGVDLDRLLNAVKHICEKHNSLLYVRDFITILSNEKPPVINMIYNQEFVTTIEEQISVLHDIYTVLRMLKPINLQPQKNIIFYGGNAHVDNLIVLLEYFGFHIIENNSQEIEHRCVKIKNDIS